MSNRTQTSLWHSILPQQLPALTNRNYRIFLSAELLGLMSTWMQTTAQTWLILTVASSPLEISLVAMIQSSPALILTLLGGVVADRTSKRHILLLTQFICLVQTVVLATLVVSHAFQFWQIYVFAAIQGTSNALAAPAREAFAVELVEKKTTTNAIGLYSVIFNAARVVGPGAAGLLITVLGVPATMFIGALGFAAFILRLRRVDTTALFTEAPVQKPSRESIVEGLRYIRETPTILWIVITISGIGVFGYTFGVTLPLVSEFVLHTDAAGFGALNTAFAFGGLIAALIATFSKRISERRLIVSASVFSLLLFSFAFSFHFWVTACILIGLGLSGMTVAITANMLLQQYTPAALRGRIMSVYIFIFSGGAPIAALLIGASTKAFGVPITIVSCALLSGAGIISAWIYRQRTKAQQFA